MNRALRPEDQHFATRAIHAGSARRSGQPIVSPVTVSSTYQEDPAAPAEYDDILYLRLNNSPNHVALANKLADLEGAETAIVTSSGMAAIATTLLTVLRPGDTLVTTRNLYGGTHSFLENILCDWGIHRVTIDLADPESWPSREDHPGVRALYAETLSNPLLEVAPLDKLAEYAQREQLCSIVDSTFATPFNVRPAELGWDLILHSATKYLGGHSDLCAGVIAGSEQRVNQVRKRLNLFGGTSSPRDLFLLDRGLKTLPLRMRQHNHSAIRIAQYLTEHPRVKRVYYPSLESHSSYQTATRLLEGGSGMLSFEFNYSEEQLVGFLRRLELLTYAPSLGGVETLITRPAKTSHGGLTPAEREALGLSNSLLRLSVGCEETDDIINDLSRAIAHAESIQ